MSQPTPDSAARRELLQLLGFCSVTSLIPAARTLAKAPALLSSEALAPNVLWIRGAGCNVVVIRDARGLAFIDGGLAVHADAVLRHAREKLGAGPAHTLINTHWHPEHVGLNETLGKAGAKIVAHENTRLWLSTTVERELDGAAVKPLAPKARPNATTYTEGEIALGEETVHYGHLAQAHTDGDLYVHLRKADVLVTGGVVAGKGWSIVDYATGGWINGLVAGHRGLQNVGTADTRIVTAQGDRLLTKRELEEEGTVLAKLAEQLAKMLRAGFGPRDVLAAAPAKDYETRFGDPTEFLDQSFRSLWGHMAPDA